MRRKDREVTDMKETEDIIRKCSVCRVGMISRGKPYIAAMNFGYEISGDDVTVYLHSAPEGRKIDALSENPDVCIQMDLQAGLSGEGADGCSYSFMYESVIAEGCASAVTEKAGKIHALSMIMRHQTGSEEDFAFGEEMLDAVCVFSVKCSSISAKRNVK